MSYLLQSLTTLTLPVLCCCCLAKYIQHLSYSGPAQAAKKVPAEMFGTEELRELVAKMVTAMREAPGVGLAAPQIGISLQVRPCAYLCVLASFSPHHGQCTPPHAANWSAHNRCCGTVCTIAALSF